LGLNLKNDEAHQLARELAALTGESMTAAVTAALRERVWSAFAPESAPALPTGCCWLSGRIVRPGSKSFFGPSITAICSTMSMVFRDYRGNAVIIDTFVVIVIFATNQMRQSSVVYPT